MHPWRGSAAHRQALPSTWHPLLGEDLSEHVDSRFCDRQGNTLGYLYELAGDTLMIWAGDKGSPADFEGRFTDNAASMSGQWVYPGGGGYQSTMTRLPK
jgi:hypothetical protein